VNRALFSNISEHWGTPKELYDSLDREFHFTLDPCPLASPMQPWKPTLSDGLLRSWKGERVYCNPPYGPGIIKWIRKSKEADLAVYLLPARTDTAWWHGWALNAEEVRFLRGRLKFGGSENSAPFPSVILVFRGGS
jgi:site-specific DNA-methyltransferase (adenine-specific)